jgi:chromosome segregation ATPase
MPTQPVIERLKELQTELETVSAAVKHIDEASKVAETAAKILKKLPELISDLKDLEENHRQELLKVHKEKIEDLEKELLSLLAQLKKMSMQLTQLVDETKKLEKSISDYLSEIKRINFPERLDKIDNQISAINIGVGNLQSAIQSTQTKIDAVQSSVGILSQKIDSKFYDLEIKIAADNAFLKKEIKANKIIVIALIAISIVVTLILKFIK